jgi:hypothetical protein
MKKIVIFLFSLAACSSCFAQPALVDPGIPDGEKIVYSSNMEGNRKIDITEEVSARTESGREIYEIISRSEFEDKKIKLVKATMAVLAIRSVRKFPDATIESNSDFSPKKDGETRVADFSALRYVLRGFPFDGQKTIKMNTFGRQGEQAYAIVAKLAKKEKVKAPGGTFECYKLELGMEGFWAGFFPKMYAWYSVDPPHFLVRFESSAIPQPGKRVIELKSYGAAK